MPILPSNLGGGAPQVSSSVAQKAGTPSWEVQALDTLSNEGALNGVNPNDLIGIQMAEEGYGGNSYGSARSSTGAGGYFGLSATNYSYGGQNYPITPGELSGTSQTDYMLQAQAASASFANQLKNAHGNVLLAEHYYQMGPNSRAPLSASDGPGIFQQLGISGSQSVGPASSQVSSSGSTSNTQAGASQPIFGVLGGPTVGSVAIFFVGVLVLGIGGFLLVAGTIKGKGGGTPVPVPV